MFARDNLNRWITATAKYPIAFTCTYVHSQHMHSRLSAFVSTTTVHTLWTVTLFRKLKSQNRLDFWMEFYHRCVFFFPAIFIISNNNVIVDIWENGHVMIGCVRMRMHMRLCVQQADEWHVNNMRLVCFSLSFLTICKSKRKKSSNKLHGNDDERLSWKEGMHQVQMRMNSIA